MTFWAFCNDSPIVVTLCVLAITNMVIEVVKHWK